MSNDPPQWNVDAGAAMFAASISSSNHVCYSSLANNQNGPSCFDLEPYANAIDTSFIRASDSGNDRSVTDAKFSRRKNEKRIRDGVSFPANNIAARRTVLSISVLGFGKARRAKCQSKRLISFAAGMAAESSEFLFSEKVTISRWYRTALRSLLLLLPLVNVDIQWQFSKRERLLPRSLLALEKPRVSRGC